MGVVLTYTGFSIAFFILGAEDVVISRLKIFKASLITWMTKQYVHVLIHTHHVHVCQIINHGQTHTIIHTHL